MLRIEFINNVCVCVCGGRGVYGRRLERRRLHRGIGCRAVGECGVWGGWGCQWRSTSKAKRSRFLDVDPTEVFFFFFLILAVTWANPNTLPPADTLWLWVYQAKGLGVWGRNTMNACFYACSAFAWIGYWAWHGQIRSETQGFIATSSEMSRCQWKPLSSPNTSPDYVSHEPQWLGSNRNACCQSLNGLSLHI